MGVPLAILKVGIFTKQFLSDFRPLLWNNQSLHGSTGFRKRTMEGGPKSPRNLGEDTQDNGKLQAGNRCAEATAKGIYQVVLFLFEGTTFIGMFERDAKGVQREPFI